MSTPKRILDIGQCGVDGPRIARFLVDKFQVQIDRAHSAEQALAMAAQTHYDLILVNRLLNRDGSPGLDIIQSLLTQNPALHVMLVSDLPEAQTQAQSLGALPGFGKSQLESEATTALICKIIC